MKNLVLDNILDLQQLNNQTFQEYLDNKFALDKIDVTELTPNMFKGNNYILNKYFFLKDHSLDRLHCFNITAEEYKDMVKKLVKQPTKESDLELETASTYWRRKVFTIILAKDLGIMPNKLDMSEYIHDIDYYQFYDFDDNQEWLENKYREEDNELPTYTNRTGVVDTNLIRELQETCIFLIKNRLAIILDVYPILCAIDDILEYTNGFSTNCLKEQLRTLDFHKARLSRIFNCGHRTKDGQFIANCDSEGNILDPFAVQMYLWLREGNNDYTCYAKEDTLKMYIEEYHKILEKLNSVKGEYSPYSKERRILSSYLHMTIKNPIDSHISQFFTLPDISDYLYSHIEELNNRKIKLTAVEDNENTVEEYTEEVEC